MVTINTTTNIVVDIQSVADRTAEISARKSTWCQTGKLSEHNTNITENISINDALQRYGIFGMVRK